MKLSLCVPTYNRARHLANLLHSAIAAARAADADVEICVSDNHSTDDTPRVVREAQQRFPVKYRRNERNLGIAGNFLAVVDIAEGEFAWLLGDDDLLFPDSAARICRLIVAQPGVDFFYVNSCLASAEYVLSQPQPFDVARLPASMPRFSSWTRTGPLPFLDLVDPDVSFDFLMGMYLAVFRRERWREHVGALDPAAVADPRTFSHFDNTCPHLSIFSRAFAGSQAYFEAEPASVSLSGAREWAPMYPLVRSVRMVEALEHFRRNGLGFGRYWRCRNAALRHFLPDLAYILANGDRAGRPYVRPLALALSNMAYPNFWLSPAYYVLRKLGTLLK